MSTPKSSEVGERSLGTLCLTLLRTVWPWSRVGVKSMPSKTRSAASTACISEAWCAAGGTACLSEARCRTMKAWLEGNPRSSPSWPTSAQVECGHARRQHRQPTAVSHVRTACASTASETAFTHAVTTFPCRSLEAGPTQTAKGRSLHHSPCHVYIMSVSNAYNSALRIQDWQPPLPANPQCRVLPSP